MRKELIFLCSLFTIVFIVYFPSLDNGFTYLDDQVQVVNNATITDLTYANFKQIFSSISVGMYQPFTTIIYAIIYQFSALNSFGYHLVGLLFHCLNCLLVLILLKEFIQNRSILFLLSSVFVLHPMQVESVAWVSAFSTLVSTAFYLLSLIFYFRYQKRNITKNYLLCFFFFLMACLSKSSAVTLPLVLVLIDYYKNKKIKPIKWLNKLPFFTLSVLFGVITIYSRESAGHLSDLSVQFGYFERIFLVAYSILFYPFKFLIPVQLSAFYPYPDMVDGILPAKYYLALPVLIVLSLLIFKKRDKYQILFGFLFFLITISLVIQLIPVGNQLTTDRYIYLPMLGLLIVIGSILKPFKNKSWIYALFIIPFLLAFKTKERAMIWSNDQKIWEDVIQNYPNVAQAYNNLGSYILTSNQQDQALIYFNKAIELKPYYADAYSNRGSLLAAKGDSKGAIEDYNKAIELRPHADAYFNRANEFSKLNDFNSAIADYSRSMELKPSPDALTNRAFALIQQRKNEQAKKDLEKSIKLYPKYDRSYFLMGLLYQIEGNQLRSCESFRKANQLGNVQAAAMIKQYCQTQ